MPDRSTLPYSEEMEKCLLYSLINSSEARRKCALPDAVWYLPHHRDIYKSILRVSETQNTQTVDYFSVKEDLKRNKLLEKVGGDQELVRIWDYMQVGGDNWRHYENRLTDYYSRREMIQRCWQIEAKMYDLSIDFAQERGHKMSV